MRVGLIAALRTETRRLLSRLRWVRKEGPDGMSVFSHQGKRGELILVETGMGAERSLNGASLLLERYGPEHLVSFGFGGGLTATLRPGDALRATSLCFFDESAASFRQANWGIDEHGPSPGVWRDIPAGTVVTTGGAPKKASLARLLPASRHPAQVDMETAHVAGFASHHGIQFSGLRAVCDELGFEPNLPLDRIMDPFGRESPWKAARVAVADPRMAFRFLRLARRSLAAGGTLAERVAMLLEE
jgi:nucleoside phosphorylase